MSMAHVLESRAVAAQNGWNRVCGRVDEGENASGGWVETPGYLEQLVHQHTDGAERYAHCHELVRR